MRSIPYADIERGVAAIAGIDPTNVLAHEKAILAEYITDATKFCWDYYPWGEVTITEKRYFRDVWSGTGLYTQGSEVYHDGKFYRNHNLSGNNTDPTLLIDWHELGDDIEETEWSEDGLYGIGARVSKDGKSYVCTAASALGRTNFLTDGVVVTDTDYFYEVDQFFERFIDYEQTGKNSIDNCLGIFTDDPRYADAKHYNFREGREGIYIEAGDSIENEFWMIYKVSPPVFTSTSTTGDIPRFLAQAIKAHAYQSWLVGEGQHEKSQLQELKILDLLVREVDKIDLQANKNKPYSIQHSSHRIINSRQDQVTAGTPHLIGRLVEAESDLTFKLGTSVQGRNPFIKSTLDLYFCIKTEVEGQDILDPRRKYGTTTCHSNLRVPAITSRAIKTRSVSQINSSLSVAGVNGFDAGQASSVDPISISIQVAPPYGNFIYANEADSSFGLNVAPIIVERLFANRVNINMGLSVQAQYEMPVFIEQRKQIWFNDNTSTSGRYFALGRDRAIDLTDTNTQLGVGNHKISIRFVSIGMEQSLSTADNPLTGNQNVFMTALGASMQNSTSIFSGDYPVTLFLMNSLDMRGGINSTVKLNGQALTPFYQTPENNSTNASGSMLPIVNFNDNHRQSITGVTDNPSGGNTQYINFAPLPYVPSYANFTRTKKFWGGTIYKLYPNYTSSSLNDDTTNEIEIQVNTSTNDNKVHVAMGFLPEINPDYNQTATNTGLLEGGAPADTALKKAYQILDLDSVSIENL